MIITTCPKLDGKGVNPMATVNLSFGHLVGYGCKPEEILAQVQAMEKAGLKVNLQVQEPEGLRVLRELPEVQQHQRATHRLSLPVLMGIGALGGLASILLGLSGVLLP